MEPKTFLRLPVTALMSSNAAPALLSMSEISAGSWVRDKVWPSVKRGASGVPCTSSIYFSPSNPSVRMVAMASLRISASRVSLAIIRAKPSFSSTSSTKPISTPESFTFDFSSTPATVLKSMKKVIRPASPKSDVPAVFTERKRRMNPAAMVRAPTFISGESFMSLACSGERPMPG